MKTKFGQIISFPCVEACCFFDSFQLLNMLFFGLKKNDFGNTLPTVSPCNFHLFSFWKQRSKFPLLSSFSSFFGGNQREMVVDIFVLMNFCIIKFGWEIWLYELLMPEIHFSVLGRIYLETFSIGELNGGFSNWNLWWFKRMDFKNAQFCL